jgi:hypothetical protein
MDSKRTSTKTPSSTPPAAVERLRERHVHQTHFLRRRAVTRNAAITTPRAKVGQRVAVIEQEEPSLDEAFGGGASSSLPPALAVDVAVPAVCGSLAQAPSMQ